MKSVLKSSIKSVGSLFLALSLVSCANTATTSKEQSVYAVPKRMTLPKGTQVIASNGQTATLPEDVEAVTLDEHLTKLSTALGQ